jgi:hypothetical protein
MATVQSYVEANFLNDMLIVEGDIMQRVLESESRKVIRSVLSEIYFAHICTLFIENIISNQIRDIA